MISRETFAGNRKILDYLNKALEKGCVSHAYLFEGPRHVGKTTMALHFAAHLLDDDFENVRKNPDFLFVSAEDDENRINIEAIRELQKNLSLYPYGAKYKVAVIEGAELMNAAAANALLKTLEEPGATSVLILISSDAGKMLDTIKSRCQAFSFNTVKREALRDFLESRGVEKNIGEILDFADGKPGAAIALSADEEALKNAREIRKKIVGLFDKDDFQKMREAALIGALDKKEAAEILDIWTSELRKELVSGLQAGDRKRVVRIKNAIEKTISVRGDILDSNANLKLAVENLCLGF